MLGVKLLKPFAAERKCTEILIDNTKQLSCGVSSYGFLVKIESLHVMAAIHVFPYVSLTRRSEGFNGILFAFLHLVLIWALDNRHALASMNLVPLDAMTAKVLDCLNSISLALNFDLIRFHGLLNGFTDLTESGIDTRVTNAGICRIFYSLEEVIVGWVERNCECAVGHDSAHVAAVVNLHDIVLL